MSSHASYRANHIRSINHLCNTKCVWSIPLWMEAPHQGQQGHTHQVSCYYFCSYIILKDNQKRLTWLVCGSPYNYHSVLSPATYLLNTLSTHGLGPKLAVSSVVYNPEEQSGGCTDLGNDVIRCHSLRACTRRSDRRLTDRMWYKRNSHGCRSTNPLFVVASANLCLTCTP
jgi:hypothetical protein